MQMPISRCNPSARRLLSAFLASAPVALIAGSAAADVSSFYKGKEIKLVVSSGAGGGYDSYSRLLAAHMGQHVPGNPSLVVENMPGTGGIKAANHLYNEAARDGSVIGGVQRLVPLTQILGDKRAKYVAARFNWLGSMNNEVTVCVAWHQSSVKTLEDVKRLPLVIGGSGPNDTELVPAFLNNTLGTNFDIVTGYPSSTAITLAMESGEVEGTCSSYSSLRSRNADWFKNKKVNVLIQTSTKKHPELPNVPLALDLAPDAELRALLELNESRLAIGRPYLAPPDVPADRVAALRSAFDRTMADSTFVAQAKLQRRDVTPLSGDDVQDLINRISKVSSTTIARLNGLQEYRAKKAGAKIALKEVSGPVVLIKNEGRRVALKDEDEGGDYEAKLSPTRTLVSVAGKSATPGAIAVGMKCTVLSLGSGQEAVTVTCDPT